MRIAHNATRAMALLMAAVGAYDDPVPRESRANKPEPRRFTDARKAAAEAKRQRKAAKREKGGTP